MQSSKQNISNLSEGKQIVTILNLMAKIEDYECENKQLAEMNDNLCDTISKLEEKIYKIEERNKCAFWSDEW